MKLFLENYRNGDYQDALLSNVAGLIRLLLLAEINIPIVISCLIALGKAGQEKLKDF